MLPVFQTSPAAGLAGAVPLGTLSEALVVVEAAMVCLALKVFAAPSCAKLPDASPFSVAAFTPVSADPLPLNDVAVTAPLTV